MAPGEQTFFATPAELRSWFDAHHADTPELLVGFHRKGSGRASITWPEAVDEALCVGWIDGVRRTLDAFSYTIRFTPRRRRSIWSAVNIRRVGELTAQGRMRAEGLQRFEERVAARSAVYGHEQKVAARLDPAQQRQFDAVPAARQFFLTQPPSYRKLAIHWVVSAKREETRQRRLATLIADSAEQRRLAHLTWRPRGDAAPPGR